MSASTTLEAGPGVSKFYAWEFPGAPVRIHLYLDVVREIQNGLKPDSGDSAPARGLLLGKIARPGLPEITGFRPIAQGNAGDVEAAVALCKNSADGQLPLGYFRVQKEGHLALGPEDLSLAQSYFSDPNSVFLLIQPSATGPANAGFFYWDRGRVNGGFYDFCFLEFPFDAATLADGHGSGKADPQPPADSAHQEPATTAVEPAPAAPPPLLVTRIISGKPAPPVNSPAKAPAPPVVSDGTALPPAARARATGPSLNTTTKGEAGKARSWRVARFAAGIFLLTVAAVAAGVFLPLKLGWVSGQSKNLESAPIALKVDRQGTDLSVTWNHNAPLVTRAVSGRLTIFDGDSASREFSLNQEYLHSGSIVYAPASDHVRVQLEIQTPDQRTTSESVVVLLNQREGAGSSVTVRPVESTPARPSRPAPMPRASSPREIVPPNNARATKEFRAPEHSRKESEPAQLAAPPPVTVGNSKGPTTAMAVTLPPPRPSPPKPNAAPAPSAPAARPPETTRPSSRLAFPDGSSDYTPPVPIRKPLPPPLTLSQRAFVRGTTLVEIKVSIDASGNVRKAEPVAQANPALASAAQNVARQWTFRPATKAGQNVPSEIVLQFKFEPPK